MSRKPPVVIVHGMWSTPDALLELKESFETQGYEVHTPRLPYHFPKAEMGHANRVGLSKSGMLTYVSSIEQYINSLEHAPILIGHSMGGLIAQLVAVRTPCAALILLSSAPPAGMNAWSWTVIRTFGHNLFKFPLWKKLTDLRIENIRYGIANTQSAKFKREVFELSTYESGLASFQLGMWFLFKNPPTRVDTNAITCPILILGGVEDKITPITLQRKIAQTFKGKATLIELAGVCHWTLGGHALPEIQQHLFSWLTNNNITRHSTRAA